MKIGLHQQTFALPFITNGGKCALAQDFFDNLKTDGFLRIIGAAISKDFFDQLGMIDKVSSLL